MLCMDTPFLDLLKQIASGVVIYEPFHRTAQDMQDFQDTVARLQEMERLGLGGRVFTQARTTHGVEFYDLAMVRGGLSAEGERLLQEYESRSERADAGGG